MKRVLYTAIISALLFFAGCDDTLYEVYNDFTGPVESVALPATMSVEVHTTEKLKASVYPKMTGNKNVTWSSADSSIASVDSDGVVTGIIVNQSTVITVTTEEGGFAAQCTVTVVPKPIPITKLSFENSTETIAITGQIQLTAEITPSDATSRSLTWSSSKSSVATVNSDGLVSGLKAGTAVITAESVKWGVTGTCTVNVIDATLIESVTFDITSYTTTKTENVQITATILPADATNKNLSWNSSNEEVATVDSTGLVSILVSGTAVITATTRDGSNITKFFNLTATGYSVTYNGNYNTDGTVPSDTNTYLEGQSFTTKAQGTLVYYDRDLLGWNTASDASGAGCSAGGAMTMGSSAMTLYVNWEVYALKETGPAGGWIFYDKGSYSDGWRYMEAASSDYSIEVCWNIGSNYHDTGATGTSIGAGKSNTIAIIDVQGTEVNAALVSTYSRDGYSDWFLPSRDEFATMVAVLKTTDSSSPYGFSYWPFYWTSTEYSSNNAYEYSCGYGGQNTPKNNENRIRPVRRF